MKAAVSVIQVIILLVVAMALVYITFNWTVQTVGKSTDITEVNTIKSQFDDCSGRIIDTARTGSENTCLFNIKDGTITGEADGVYYNLLSSAPICDPAPLTEIDSRNHIWQGCNVTGGMRLYTMVWKYPSTIDINGTGVIGSQITGNAYVSQIKFDSPIVFNTLTLYVNFQYQQGQTGDTVEFSRVDVTSTNVTIELKIS